MSSKRVLTLWNNEGENPKDTSVLRKKSVELPVPLDKDHGKIIQAFNWCFYGKEDDAVGLAAPQIGINKRVIAFRAKRFWRRPGKNKKINEIEYWLIHGLLRNAVKK